jgi:hypothetical protein
MHVAMVSLPLADLSEPGVPGDLTLFDVRPTLTLLWSRHGDLAAVTQADVAPVRYTRRATAPWGERRDLQVDVFAGGGDFADRGAAVRFWLARVDNLALGPVLVTGGAGLASANVGPFVTATAREIQLTTPRVEVAVDGGDAALHGVLRATRDAAIVPDGYATIDSRLAGGLRGALASTPIALDASVASTEVHVPGQPSVTGRTGGAALAVAHRLAPYLEATLQVEGARSFYAADVTAMTGAPSAPRWGLQAFASLQAAIGR